MHKLAQLDHLYVWHPFTQMKDWLSREPIVIVEGHRAVLKDVYGNEYLDANSSIWTNLHGHAHPAINDSIKRQLDKISHSSALGFANEPASLLAETLIKSATLERYLEKSEPPDKASQPELTKVFFSDNGSTAMEVALKLSYQFGVRTGQSKKPRFLSMDGAYHGDTVGAVSLGHIDLFHAAYSGLLFQADKVMAPYCYRCPYNRAKPDRADARSYRKCQWECVGKVEEQFARQKAQNEPYTAMVVEPLMQGAAGMIPQPEGWLRQVAAITRSYGAQLIADEVMTGFGRTGLRAEQKRQNDEVGNAAFRDNNVYASLYACHQEGVQPDFLALAKGMTGGYVPMAATLVTQAVFDAFLGEYSEFKTFFHGHSFTGNQIGSAAALASLDILKSAECLSARAALERALRDALSNLWRLRHIGDIRQVGLVVGIELVRDWTSREPFQLSERVGIRVCEAMARRGVLTRPIGNVIVLMPPYCTTPAQAQQIVDVLYAAVEEIVPD